MRIVITGGTGFLGTGARRSSPDDGSHRHRADATSETRGRGRVESPRFARRAGPCPRRRRCRDQSGGRVDREAVDAPRTNASSGRAACRPTRTLVEAMKRTTPSARHVDQRIRRRYLRRSRRRTAHRRESTRHGFLASLGEAWEKEALAAATAHAGRAAAEPPSCSTRKAAPCRRWPCRSGSSWADRLDQAGSTSRGFTGTTGRPWWLGAHEHGRHGPAQRDRAAPGHEPGVRAHAWTGPAKAIGDAGAWLRASRRARRNGGHDPRQSTDVSGQGVRPRLQVQLSTARTGTAQIYPS